MITACFPFNSPTFLSNVSPLIPFPPNAFSLVHRWMCCVCSSRTTLILTFKSSLGWASQINDHLLEPCNLGSILFQFWIETCSLAGPTALSKYSACSHLIFYSILSCKDSVVDGHCQLLWLPHKFIDYIIKENAYGTYLFIYFPLKTCTQPLQPLSLPIVIPLGFRAL